jgi:hypothetical protein
MRRCVVPMVAIVVVTLLGSGCSVERSGGDARPERDGPDEEIVTGEGDHYVADSTSDAPGSGGTRHFRFEAQSAGTTTVELLNCFQGCQAPEDERRYVIDIEVG